jgi:hypothetical protein
LTAEILAVTTPQRSIMLGRYSDGLVREMIKLETGIQAM